MNEYRLNVLIRSDMVSGKTQDRYRSIHLCSSPNNRHASPIVAMMYSTVGGNISQPPRKRVAIFEGNHVRAASKIPVVVISAKPMNTGSSPFEIDVDKNDSEPSFDWNTWPRIIKTVCYGVRIRGD